MLQGQQDARARGLSTWPAELVSATQVKERELLPCLMCARTPSSEPSSGGREWGSFLERYLAQLETRWERQFVTDVLPRVPGLLPNQVEPQKVVRTSDGRSRRIDFAFSIGMVRLAIEIGGLDKTGRGVIGRAEHEDFARRQTELAAAGWTMIRFTNSLVSTEPAYCAGQIQETLARLRSADGHGNLYELQAAIDARFDHLEQRLRPEASPSIAPREVQTHPASGKSRRHLSRWLAATAFMVLALGAVWFLQPDDTDAKPRPATISSTTCPDDAPIKGNVSASGAHIFHQPGWHYYTKTKPEQCFATVEAAMAAGFRASSVK